MWEPHGEHFRITGLFISPFGIGEKIFLDFFGIPRLSLVAQLVKNLPAVWEAWVRSLGREDSLEESMATHSSILAC